MKFNSSEESCARYKLLKYIQAFGATVISISPKLVSLGGKEIALMHIILQRGEKIWSLDIWPQNHLDISEISSLPTHISDLGFCIYYKTFNDDNKESFPLWSSYYCGDKEIHPSGPEITYDLYQGAEVSQIYNRAYPLMPTYSLTDNLLFIDTETTGLPKDPSAPSNNTENWPRLVQIAWALTDKRGNIIEEFQSIIKPTDFTIPHSASSIHHISQADAMLRGRQLQEVLYCLNSVACQARCIVGHNVSFDLNVIDAEMIRCEIENNLKSKERFCTMIESEQFCNLPDSKYPKLSELYQKLFETPLTNTHDAMEDVRTTMKCYWEMQRRGIHYVPDDMPF